MWTALLAGQQRVVTRAQARRCGLTDAMVDDNLQRGRWQILLPQTFLVGPGPVLRGQWITAALLYAGPTAALDGLSALQLHGVRYLPPTDHIYVVVARTRRLIEHERLAHRRTTFPIRTDPRFEFPVLALPDALAAAALKQRSLRTVRAFTADAVQRGLTSADALQEALAFLPSRGTAHVRTALDDLNAGTRSAPEAETRDFLLACRELPEPQWNVTLVHNDGTVLGCVDGYLHEAALVLEIDSQEHHGYAEKREATARRRSRATSYGLTVLSWSPRRVREDRPALREEFLRAYRLGLRRGPAPGIRVLRRAAWARQR